MSTLRRNTLISLPEGQTFQPEKDFIVVEPIVHEAISPGGVRFAEGMQETCAGIVLRVGPGLLGQNDQIIPPFCKVGQAVVLNPMREVLEVIEGRRKLYVAGDRDICGRIHGYAPPIPESADQPQVAEAACEEPVAAE